MKYKLGECIEEIVDKTTKNNQYEVLSVTKDGIYSQEEFFKKQIASEDNTGYKIIRKNNLVFSTMNLWMGSLDVLSNYEIGIVSPAYKIFKFDESKMIPSFGKYFMKSHFMLEQYKDCSEQGASVVRRNLDLKQLLDTEIIIPKVEEQCKIVKILENIDEIINKYTNLIRNKDQFIKSQFVEMFEKDITVKKTTVNNVADIYLGLTYTPKYTETGIPFLSSKNISSQKLDLEDIKYISQEEYDNATNNAKPINGDILFSRVGSNLGNPTIFETNIKCAIFVSLGYLRIKNINEFDNVFVRDWMKSDNFWHQVFNKVSGGAKQNLNTNWLKNFEIPNPSLEKQIKYKNIVQLIDKQKFELEKQKQNYIDLKKGLMQQLLTGKLKV